MQASLQISAWKQKTNQYIDLLTKQKTKTKTKTKQTKKKQKPKTQQTNKQTNQKQNKTNQTNKVTIRRPSVFENLLRVMKPSFKYNCDYVLARYYSNQQWSGLCSLCLCYLFGIFRLLLCYI